jgi:hypothetical protein
MHADAMYHKLTSQEAEIEAAKAEGRPVPKFAPLIPKKPMVSSPMPEPELTLEQQETLKRRLEKVPEEDRPTEAEAYKAEERVKTEIAGRLKGIWDQQEAERQARKDTGQQTTWDKVMGTIRGGNEKK